MARKGENVVKYVPGPGKKNALGLHRMVVGPADAAVLDTTAFLLVVLDGRNKSHLAQ